MWPNIILIVIVIGVWGTILIGMLRQASRQLRASGGKSGGVSLLPIFPFVPFFFLASGIGLNYFLSPSGTWIVGTFQVAILTVTLVAVWKNRKSVG